MFQSYFKCKQFGKRKTIGFSPTSTALGRLLQAAASIWVRLLRDLQSEKVRLLFECSFLSSVAFIHNFTVHQCDYVKLIKKGPGWFMDFQLAWKKSCKVLEKKEENAEKNGKKRSCFFFHDMNSGCFVQKKGQKHIFSFLPSSRNETKKIFFFLRRNVQTHNPGFLLLPEFFFVNCLKKKRRTQPQLWWAFVSWLGDAQARLTLTQLHCLVSHLYWHSAQPRVCKQDERQPRELHTLPAWWEGRLQEEEKKNSSHEKRGEITTSTHTIPLGKKAIFCNTTRCREVEEDLFAGNFGKEKGNFFRLLPWTRTKVDESGGMKWTAFSRRSWGLGRGRRSLWSRTRCFSVTCTCTFCKNLGSRSRQMAAEISCSCYVPCDDQLWDAWCHVIFDRLWSREQGALWRSLVRCCSARGALSWVPWARN